MAGMHNWEIVLERQREIESLRAQLAIARKALEAVSVVDAHGWAVAPMNFSLRKQIATALDAIKADPQ